MHGSTEEQVQCEIEMLLRSYGLTSTTGMSSFQIEEKNGTISAFSGLEIITDLTEREIALLRAIKGVRESLRIERINIQLTREVGLNPTRGQIVDFGHINVRRSFRHPVCSVVRDRLFCLGGILWPEDEEYVQPDPKICLPYDSYERLALNELCFALALKFRRSEISREELQTHLEQPIRELIELWNENV